VTNHSAAPPARRACSPLPKRIFNDKIRKCGVDVRRFKA
jgi:hypothetical protein